MSTPMRQKPHLKQASECRIRHMSLECSTGWWLSWSPMTCTQKIHMATNERRLAMSKEQENKVIVGQWFKQFWGNP